MCRSASGVKIPDASSISSNAAKRAPAAATTQVSRSASSGSLALGAGKRKKDKAPPTLFMRKATKPSAKPAEIARSPVKPGSSRRGPAMQAALDNHPGVRQPTNILNAGRSRKSAGSAVNRRAQGTSDSMNASKGNRR